MSSPTDAATTSPHGACATPDQPLMSRSDTLDTAHLSDSAEPSRPPSSASREEGPAAIAAVEQDLPAAEDAALALLAFCDVASARRHVPAPVAARRDTAHMLPPPFAHRSKSMMVTPQASSLNDTARGEGHDGYGAALGSADADDDDVDDDLRPRARGGPARKRHWSGVYREKDAASAEEPTDERTTAERRARMNHLRRCNEDMRILLLGWKAVEVPNDKGGLTYEYEHTVTGRRAKSKKMIFKMHRGEKLDFNSDEAAVLSERVRELRQSDTIVAAVSGTPSDTAPGSASSAPLTSPPGAAMASASASAGPSPPTFESLSAPRLSPLAYSDLAASVRGSGSPASHMDLPVAAAGGRTPPESQPCALAAPPTEASVCDAESGKKRMLGAVELPLAVQTLGDADASTEASPHTCGKRPVKQWPEWGVGEAAPVS
jgi:hypothetical protein